VPVFCRHVVDKNVFLTKYHQVGESYLIGIREYGVLAAEKACYQPQRKQRVLFLAVDLITNKLLVATGLLNREANMLGELFKETGHQPDSDSLDTVQASEVRYTKERGTPDHSWQLFCDMRILNEISVEYEAAHAMTEQEKW